MSDKDAKEAEVFDTELYDTKEKFEGYVDSIDVDDDAEMDGREQYLEKERVIRDAKREVPEMEDDDPNAEVKTKALFRHRVCVRSQMQHFTMPRKVIERETDYQKRKYGRRLSPERQDAYAMGDHTPDANVRSYADTMKEQMLDMERENTMRNIASKKREDSRDSKRNRWDKHSEE